MSNLSGRLAVVTGAGRGIGSEIARRLAVAGAEVVIADIDLRRSGNSRRGDSGGDRTRRGDEGRYRIRCRSRGIR